MLVNNQRFVSAEVIAYELSDLYKSKTWDIGRIRTWCANVETRYIRDIETMAEYEDIDLTVSNGMLLLPCNIYRILDVFPGAGKSLSYKNNGAYLYDFKLNGQPQTYIDGTVLYINYSGTNINTDTGEILIVKGHEEACKTYCKMQMFEEDAAMGSFSMNMWLSWVQMFGGQHIAARYNTRHKSREKIDRLNIIRGNMIPKIGSLVLHHELFK